MFSVQVGCAANWDEYEMDDTGACKLHEIDGVHDGLTCPSEEQLATLQRVGDAIPWNAYCTFSPSFLFEEG
jgi:hypothetical protein